MACGVRRRDLMLSHHDPMAGPAFDVRGTPSPLIATAIHAGHVVRPEVGDLLAISPEQRRYREDPYTDRWAGAVGGKAFVVHRSRFEFDLDRPRSEAVYRGGDDAWGLDVWSEPLPEAVVQKSLALYDAVYGALEAMITDAIVREGAFALLDFHAYNRRRREGSASERRRLSGAETRIGTDGVPPRWTPTVGRLVHELSRQEIGGRRLHVDVDSRSGGELARWTNRTFGDRGFAVRVGVEKITMDEDTGEFFLDAEVALEKALTNATRATFEDLVSQ